MTVTSYGAAKPGGAVGGYTGGTGNWGSGSSSSKSGGDSKSSGSSSKSKSPPNCPKDQVFECIGRGLKPNTDHKFFYENVDRTQDCKQLGSNNASTTDDGKLGGPLITDKNGYVRFNFYFTAAVEQQVDALNKVNYSLVGDKKFELRAVDSTAKKIVPFTVSKASNTSSKSLLDSFGKLIKS